MGGGAPPPSCILQKCVLITKFVIIGSHRNSQSLLAKRQFLTSVRISREDYLIQPWKLLSQEQFDTQILNFGILQVFHLKSTYLYVVDVKLLIAPDKQQIGFKNLFPTVK